MKSTFTLALLVIALISGCSSTPKKPLNPPSAEISGKFASGTLTADCDDPYRCKIFELTLNNKTDDPLEIDWARSYYLDNGKPNGGLYFDGIVIAQRNNLRPPDIILPKSTFQRKLIPNNSFSLSVFPLARWTVKYFEGASHGVYITLKSGTKEEHVSVSVTLKLK